ncbi:hypothetical protein STEG23_021776, partial [Scotinomys teguina]
SDDYRDTIPTTGIFDQCEQKDFPSPVMVPLFPPFVAQDLPMEQGSEFLSHLFIEEPYEFSTLGLECIGPGRDVPRIVFHHTWLDIDTDPNLDVIRGWKPLTTADAVISIKAAMDEVKPETINALGTTGVKS